MSEALKFVNTHVVDILGSTKGRDQPIMKMDKAVELVKCLDKEALTSDEYVFFDPFCKAGEILLATALVRNLYKSKRGLVDTYKVFEDLYKSNRYFALAPDERHYLLTLRTFYGNEKSHNKNFTKNIRNGNYLSEENGRLDKDKFNKELKAMLEYIKEKTGSKKIVTVGNPPYQEEDEGYGKSAKPIYNIFIESLIDSQEIHKFSLVVPARWFSGGKGLDNFRSHMIEDKKLKKITYFENSSFVFPTVDIRGGVCFLYWDKNHKGETIIDNGNQTEETDLSKWDIIVPHTEAYSILNKVLKKGNTFVSEVVWPRKPFGLPGNYFSRNQLNYSESDQPVECLSVGKIINKIPRRLIPTNTDKINEYQVAFPEASGGGKGKRDQILPRSKHFFILERGQISTETYSVAHSFTNKKEAENFLFFLRTNFARFLLGLRKPTQHTKRETFAWIPLLNTKQLWTDEGLFKYFNINLEEQKYIVEQVEKWTA